MKMIKYLGQNLSQEEQNYLQTMLNDDKNIDAQNEILDLIKYSPQQLLSKISKT